MDVDIMALNAAIKKESAFVEQMLTEVGKMVVGQKEMVEGILMGLLTGGHVLLEGVPGLAKTLTISSVSQAISLGFQRVQFTPDLLPSDLIGTMIFNPKSGEFTPKKGPIFTNILLADEINRAPAKVQSALLECMAEKQVTIGDTTYKLERPFLVLATQNPLEQEGTYPLPEAQLDRFIFKHVLDYPSREEEIEIVRRHGSRTGSAKPKDLGVNAVVTRKALEDAVAAVATVRLTDDVTNYVVDLVRGTRSNPLFETGASPRAAAMISGAARAHAALQSRDFVIPDDVKAIALPALRHRAILSPAAEIEGRTADELILQVIEQTEAPR